jgi:hypothetical protein
MDVNSQDNVACSNISWAVVALKVLVLVLVLTMCVFHNSLYILSAPNNMMCVIVSNNAAEKYVALHDIGIYLKTKHLRHV